MELAADVMHANDIPFLKTTYENIHCEKIVAMENLKCQSLEFELKSVIRSYAIRGFCIKLVVVDIQFKTLKDRNLLVM